jgi:2-oxoglutarate/2-oxoacid ferredoxin oxidoreductase subunit beta
MTVSLPTFVPLVMVPSEDDVRYDLGDYEGAMTRWCHGCGNNAILTSLQKLCADRQLPPERTVIVSGIGCAARLPHYMGTYGFHGLHGRAFPFAEGVRIRRPDLHLFVSTGDGDCCSIGAGHWLHAVRYNMNMTVLLHDNRVYGLTKKQASPTSPRGLVTRTTPHGARLEPLNPLAATLGMPNVSFAAQAVDWLPGILSDILRQAVDHHGLSFIRILQRCPNFLPDLFEDYVRHPDRVVLLTHEQGLQVDAVTARRFPHVVEHDPGDLAEAMELARMTDALPIGIFYRDDSVPCYEDLLAPARHFSPETKLAALERELDRFSVNPRPSATADEFAAAGGE